MDLKPVRILKEEGRDMIHEIMSRTFLSACLRQTLQHSLSESGKFFHLYFPRTK